MSGAGPGLPEVSAAGLRLRRLPRASAQDTIERPKGCPPITRGRISRMSSYRRNDRSLRLTFRFLGRDISLVERREVNMLAPPSEKWDPRTQREQSGFWLELQSSEGRTLYRRVIRHPIRANAEVALDEGGFTNRVAVA